MVKLQHEQVTADVKLEVGRQTDAMKSIEGRTKAETEAVKNKLVELESEQGELKEYVKLEFEGLKKETTKIEMSANLGLQNIERKLASFEEKLNNLEDKLKGIGQTGDIISKLQEELRIVKEELQKLKESVKLEIDYLKATTIKAISR